VADGWLGNAFIPESGEVFLGPLREGAESMGRLLVKLDGDHGTRLAALRRLVAIADQITHLGV